MALVEIKKSDYQQGPLQLAIGPNSQLLAYIQEYGEQSFRQLLGLYYDDAVANDRQKYTDLFNGIQYTDEHGEFNSFVGQGLAYVVKAVYLFLLSERYPNDQQRHGNGKQPERERCPTVGLRACSR